MKVERGIAGLFMPREKVERRAEYRYVVYDERRWELLRELREEAAAIMRALKTFQLYSIVHGSVARGDVKPTSDVDVFIPTPVPSYIVELALERFNFKPKAKFIVQATPSSTPKAYIVLDYEEKRTVSFPLAKLSKTEYEFYYFGGALDLDQLERGVRVPGVDKRLVLIEPTPDGHRESPVVGREEEVARIVGVSVDTVKERVAVLSRRDEHGRTGVFVKLELGAHESIEEAARELADRNPHFRRVLRLRGSLLV